MQFSVPPRPWAEVVSPFSQRTYDASFGHSRFHVASYGAAPVESTSWYSSTTARASPPMHTPIFGRRLRGVDGAQGIRTTSFDARASEFMHIARRTVEVGMVVCIEDTTLIAASTAVTLLFLVSTCITLCTHARLRRARRAAFAVDPWTAQYESSPSTSLFNRASGAQNQVTLSSGER